MHKSSTRTLITLLTIVAFIATAFFAVLHCTADFSAAHASPNNPAHPLASTDGCCMFLCLTALVSIFVLTPTLPYFHRFTFVADSLVSSARLRLLVPPPRPTI
jgi:hypothetical protein